jgi:hypothetical protein
MADDQRHPMVIFHIIEQLESELGGIQYDVSDGGQPPARA